MRATARPMPTRAATGAISAYADTARAQPGELSDRPACREVSIASQRSIRSMPIDWMNVIAASSPVTTGTLPVPKRNIFSMAVRLNKEALIEWMEKEEKAGANEEAEGAADPDLKIYVTPDETLATI